LDNEKLDITTVLHCYDTSCFVSCHPKTTWWQIYTSGCISLKRNE